MRVRLPSGWGRTVFLLAGLLTVSACGSLDYFGEEQDGPPLQGERLPIMALEQRLSADPQIADVPVVLPRPYVNAEWRVAGGNPAHAMQHLAAADAMTEVWSRDVGSGSGDSHQMLATPVIAGGMIFAMDSEGEVTALSEKDGATRWTVDTRAKGEKDAIFPGAIGAGDGRLFAATGSGEVIAYAMADGSELWRARVPGPVRGAPTEADGRVFVITVDNQTVALDAKTGNRIWTHTGITEESALLGGGSAAVARGSVVVPYSSGEVFVLRAENGRPLWNDNLSQIRTVTAVSRLADIRGNPVVDDGLVIAISHSGRLVATDLNSGRRVWEQRVGGVHMPWVAGDYVFVVADTGEVLALTKRTGRIRWIQQLPVFEDPEDREDPIAYAGPVLVGDRLIVAGSNGEIYAISPYSGAVLGKIDIGEKVFIAPVVAGGTLYVLTDEAELKAFR